jgi:hypothetical protein
VPNKESPKCWVSHNPFIVFVNFGGWFCILNWALMLPSVQYKNSMFRNQKEYKFVIV